MSLISKPFQRATGSAGLGARAVAALLLSTVGLVLPGWAQAEADGLAAALERLQAEDPLVADAAVEDLVALGPEAVDALLPLLASPARDVRAGAIRGLGLLGDGRARRPLTEALATSLARQAPDDMASRYHRILLVEALGRVGADAEGAGLLRGVQASDDPFERAHATIALFRSGEDPGYDAVRQLLESEDPALRVLAVNGIGEEGAAEAPDLLLPLTEDASWLVRDAAFAALAPWRAEDRVAQALRRGAEDPSWYVRETVAKAAAP